MAVARRGKQFLVVDFGSHSIKFIVASNSGEVLTVHKAFSITVPEMAYSNGVIADRSLVAELIKEALRVNSVSIRDTVLTFNSTDIITRNWTVPKLSGEDMLGVIKYEISQYLPIRIEDYDVVYKVVDTSVEDGVEKYSIDSYIVRKEIVSDFYELIKECGLTPKVLDVHSNAISKLAERLELDSISGLDVEDNNLTRVFIDIGNNNILIDVFQGYKNVLSRVVDKGYFGIDKINAEKLNVSISEAEDLRIKKFSGGLNQLVELYEKIKFIDFSVEEIDKLTCGLSMTSELMTTQERVLFDSLKDTVEYFYEMVSDINKNLSFYLSRNTKNKIDVIYYYGASMKNNNIFEFFTDNIEFESRKLNLTSLTSVVYKDDFDSLISYANAIGAAIRKTDGGNINV